MGPVRGTRMSQGGGPPLNTHTHQTTRTHTYTHTHTLRGMCLLVVIERTWYPSRAGYPYTRFFEVSSMVSGYVVLAIAISRYGDTAVHALRVIRTIGNSDDSAHFA